MHLQFDDHFKVFAQYLDNALAQPSYYPSLSAMMDDLLSKEVTHGDVLEQGISSPLVALAHLVNNPHLVKPAPAGDLPGEPRQPGVEVSIDMLVRGANEAVNLAPIQAIPVAAIAILGKSLQYGELAQSQRGIGSILVNVLDRSDQMEPIQRQALQDAVRDAFRSYRTAYPLDADTERKLSGHYHGETAKKLVTLLGFKPENVRFLSQSDRRSLSASQPAPI